MAGPGELRTERLILRQWRRSDLEPFAALNADPEVMALFPAPLGREESDSFVAKAHSVFATYGFGPWAVEVIGGEALVGYVGVQPVTFDAGFEGHMEIGWRLARAHWGQGYATEAARAALVQCLGPGGLDQVVSFTYRGNLRSRAVMERLGMRHHREEDFDHPGLPRGHRLAPHVLYRFHRSWPAAARWHLQPGQSDNGRPGRPD